MRPGAAGNDVHLCMLFLSGSTGSTCGQRPRISDRVAPIGWDRGGGTCVTGAPARTTRMGMALRRNSSKSATYLPYLLLACFTSDLPQSSLNRLRCIFQPVHNKQKYNTWAPLTWWCSSATSHLISLVLLDARCKYNTTHNTSLPLHGKVRRGPRAQRR